MMPMASQVERRTCSGHLSMDRLKGSDRHGRATQRTSRTQLDLRHDGGRLPRRRRLPWTKDAVIHDYGAFAEATWYANRNSRVVTGARVDRADATDYRQTLSTMAMNRANPTVDATRTATLPSGFARYEYDLASLPATLYAGLGHVQRFPDYWELFSSDSGPVGKANAFAGVRPEKTTQLDIGAQYDDNRLQAWVSA